MDVWVSAIDDLFICFGFYYFLFSRVSFLDTQAKLNSSLAKCPSMHQSKLHKKKQGKTKIRGNDFDDC
jgi:hypothetical protein